MFERGTRWWRRGGFKLAVGALLLGLAGCNPVETYRRWTGIAANDPNPATTPNTKNLAAGEAIGYPNLATVPPPPSRALTTAELDKLTKSLIADRALAKDTGEHLELAANEAAVPPPPPPPLVLPSPRALPSPASPPPAVPGGAAPGVVNPPAPSGTAPGSAPVAAASGGATTGAGNAAPAKGPRKAGEPPEPGPLESSLQPPQIAGLPLPEQNRPVPPPPSVLALPAKPGTAGAAGAGAHLPGPPAAAPLPAAIASAQFQPGPPPPNLPPTVPIHTTTAKPPKPTKPGPPAIAYAKVAEIAFQGDRTVVTDADRQALDKVIARYREKPGSVRIVGYAGIQPGAAEQLDAYRTALDRARAVAAALTRAGIPAGKIETEAAPAGRVGEQGRAEILFGQ